MEKKSKIFMIFGILVLVVAIVGSTLAYYVWTTSSDEETKIVSKVGAATINFDGGTDIENVSLRPVSDKSKGIVKAIKMSASTTGIKANLYLDIISIDEELKNTTFKFFLAKSSTAAVATKEGNFSTEYLTSNTVTCEKNSTNHIVLLSDYDVPTSQVTYTLYIWIDGTVDNDTNMMNKSFSFKLHADGTGGIVKEAPLPDGTGLVEGSMAEQIVTTYIDADKTTVTNNGIKYLQDTSNNLINDVDGNIRYYGATPNNYIYFNCSDYANQSSSTCETWRIIGVFEDKVKLIRGSQIGTYSWDTSSSTVNGGNGKNDWTNAKLMKLLNPGYESETAGGSLYYNAGSGNCYVRSDNATEACDFAGTGIKNDTTRILIAEETWTLRVSSISYANTAYEDERSKGSVYVGNPTKWTGKIALAYSSDYGYAVDFSKCSQTLNNYDYSVCISNNWMKAILGTSSSEWLLTPDSSDYGSAWRVGSSGRVHTFNYVYADYGVTPVLYLNANANIKSGIGSSSDPYQLSV